MGWGYLRRLRSLGRLTLRQRVACALLALLALAVPAPAWAQIAQDIETADSQVGILTNGAMANLDDMDFGVMTQPTVAATVTMVPASSTCSTSAGVIHTGPCVPARFAVMFKKHQRARIRQMNSGTILLTGPGGATMTVTNLTLSVSDMTLQTSGGPPGSFGTYRIESENGMAEFKIGGRLNIGANQAPGVYTGVLNMNVVLN